MPGKAFFLVLFLVLFLVAQAASGFAGEPDKPQAQPQASSESAVSEDKKNGPEERFSVTKHSITLAGEVLDYTATAGRMRLKDDSGKHSADIFFVSYVKEHKEGEPARPVTFAFNGGPGAASVWLHMGAIGPKRVATEERGIDPPPPPYGPVENQYSWLGFTDLVFIDPVGTGFSRSAPVEGAGNFYGIKEDIESVGAFIRLYTTRYGRWLSPKFIAGESYGSYRAVSLAEHLYSKYGMDINGLVLISVALNFQTFSFHLGNDLPYVLFLPVYTASAWYHKKLSPELQEDLQKTLHEVENWAMDEYLPALGKGDSLPEEIRGKISEKLAYYTGLPGSYIEANGLRIHRSDFMQELLRSENRTIGLMDSRTTGFGKSSGLFSDPGMALTVGPYVAVVNDYIRDQLGYELDIPYLFLSMEANRQWNWGSALRGYVNATDQLQEAISRSKHLKVFVASGYYDLTTPYFAATYTLEHLNLHPSLRKNVTIRYFEGGHMFYTNEPSLQKLTAEVASFFKDTLPAD